MSLGCSSPHLSPTISQEPETHSHMPVRALGRPQALLQSAGWSTGPQPPSEHGGQRKNGRAAPASHQPRPPTRQGSCHQQSLETVPPPTCLEPPSSCDSCVGSQRDSSIGLPTLNTQRGRACRWSPDPPTRAQGHTGPDLVSNTQTERRPTFPPPRLKDDDNRVCTQIHVHSDDQ